MVKIVAFLELERDWTFVKGLTLGGGERPGSIEMATLLILRGKPYKY